MGSTFLHPRHAERHLSERIGWLRAAVLGADDGIVSTAALVLGVAASDASRSAVIAAGFAGLVAGAMSMAAGEYVSVSSQRDTEQADLRREAAELEADPESELLELARIYERRGLTRDLARQVAEKLSEGDRLAAHARDELGFGPHHLARPIQAAVASALAFTVGALVPMLVLLVVPKSIRIPAVGITSLVALGVLGIAGAVAGGAPARRAAIRVVVGGTLAMVVTMGIGKLVGTAVG